MRSVRRHGAYFRSNVLASPHAAGLDPAAPVPLPLEPLDLAGRDPPTTPRPPERLLRAIKVPNVLPSWVRAARDSRGSGPTSSSACTTCHPPQPRRRLPRPGGPRFHALPRDARRRGRAQRGHPRRQVSEVAEELQQRRFEPVVRLELQADARPAGCASSSSASFELTERRRLRAARRARLHGSPRRSPRSTCPSSATRRGRRVEPLTAARADETRHLRRDPRAAICWCTTLTRASTPASSGSSASRGRRPAGASRSR